MRERPPCPRPIGVGPPHPGPPGTLASQERKNAPSETPVWRRGLRLCRSHCSDGPRPSAPTLGPPRGPHPSRSFKGNSPKPSQSLDPQFRRRGLRMLRKEARRSQRILPRRDWLGGVVTGRKSRRATSAGSEGFSQVGGAAAGPPLHQLEVRGTTRRGGGSGAPRLAVRWGFPVRGGSACGRAGGRADPRAVRAGHPRPGASEPCEGLVLGAPDQRPGLGAGGGGGGLRVESREACGLRGLEGKRNKQAVGN